MAITHFPRLLVARRRQVGIAAALGVSLLGLAAATWPATATPPGPTVLVRTGTFVDTLIERGTVSASRLSLYASTIAGSQAKLLDIVAEGAAVSPGTVLFRFDPAPFEDAVKRDEAALAQANADALRAREDLRLEELRVESELQQAREQIGFAETALSAERDGRGPLQLAEAEVQLNEATRELARLRSADADMRALLDKGFVTRAEAERAEQALRQAEDRHRLAGLRLNALQAFEQPAAIDKSRAGVVSARKNLDALTAATRARLSQRQATVALTDARVVDARLRLVRTQEQIARTIVRADTAGLVVYREIFFGAEKRKPQPGDEIWPNQPLIAIPDSDQLVVDTRVRETDLHRIAASQTVRVGVDAYPDLELPATVAMIGALAESDPARPATRFFPVTIRLLTQDARLRTGMTARVVVEIASQSTATLVPVEALIDDGGITRCTVVTSAGLQTRIVEVTGRNAQVAAIGSGLMPGEQVLIGDPSISRAPHP
jgi:HlyD family secretion protein